MVMTQQAVVFLVGFGGPEVHAERSTALINLPAGHKSHLPLFSAAKLYKDVHPQATLTGITTQCHYRINIPGKAGQASFIFPELYK